MDPCRELLQLGFGEGVERAEWRGRAGLEIDGVVVRVVWRKCVCLHLGECREEVVVLRGDGVAEGFDVVRWVWERRREFGEGSRDWVVGSCWLGGGVDGEVTEGVVGSCWLGGGVDGEVTEGVAERHGEGGRRGLGFGGLGFVAGVRGIGLWGEGARSRIGMPSGVWTGGFGLGLRLELGVGRLGLGH